MHWMTGYLRGMICKDENRVLLMLNVILKTLINYSKQ